MFFLAVISSSAPAWAGFIRGEVKYANGQPADHVIVRLRSDVIAYQTEASTDPRGKFDFDGLPASTYHLTIEGQGFRPYETHIDISMSKMDYEQITLYPAKERDVKATPPEGPGGLLDARLAQIPAPARKEFESGENAISDKKDPESAEKHFHKAIQIFEQYPEAHLKLGLLFLDLNRPEEAQKELQRCIELDKSAPAPYLALGALYSRQKRFPEAQTVLERGLEIKSDVPEAQYELAKTYFALQRWDEAEPHAQKAAALMPNLAPVHILLGDLALRKNDGPGALKEFQEYLKLDAKGPMAPEVQAMVKKIQDAIAADAAEAQGAAAPNSPKPKDK